MLLKEKGIEIKIQPEVIFEPNTFTHICAMQCKVCHKCIKRINDLKSLSIFIFFN